MDRQYLDMADMVNKMLTVPAKARLTPATHGSDFARMTAQEQMGYAKAMLDMIDWLYRKGPIEYKHAEQELRDYRNAKLNAGRQ